ncbi:MAG: hypothetical protein IJQ54_02470 [Kiritimatiellae bacterium]|nr:hypothetical protein [Kiritimatiellia bacterium]MBR0241371.1 hypothetical protein [Kiritimatiellia bacterium]
MLKFRLRWQRALHLRQLAELLPQAFGFGLVTRPLVTASRLSRCAPSGNPTPSARANMLNCPFKEKVGPLDLIDEIVPLRHCHCYFSSLHPKSLW